MKTEHFQTQSNPMFKMLFGVRHWVSLVATLALIASGCGSKVTDTGTETHWLSACTSDDQCGGRLSCLCNVCTRECSEVTACPNQAPHCVAAGSLDCSESEATAVCFDESENELQAADAGSIAPVKLVVPAVDDTRPDPTACDTFGWCWESPGAPGERFLAFSSDRQFAVGERGVVFATSGEYLERPTTSELTVAEVIDGELWVGSSDGLWSRSSRGWTRQGEAGVSALTVASDGEVWVLRGNVAERFDGKTWEDVTPPSSRTNPLFLADVTALEDGVVWALGSYQTGRDDAEGVVLIWDGSEWTERAAEFRTGGVRFLKGGVNPYVYHVPSSFDEPTARIFDPANAWQVVAERASAIGGTVFWGPDEHPWLSSGGGVYSFDEAEPKAESPVTCVVAVNWDSDTVLCADEVSGLTFISVSDAGVTATPSRPTFPAYAPGSYGTQPTPVWAQTNEAWGVNASDVWRAPLEHYNGRAWTSMLGDEDSFSARSIDGTASDDVWFASETELRHWDGAAMSTIDLPVTETALRILAVRALDSSHVWLLADTSTYPRQVRIFSYQGKAWVMEYDAVADELAYPSGVLAGSSLDNMWATLGHEVLHLQEGVWSLHTELAVSEHVIDAVSDDASLWLLTDSSVYQLDGAQLNVMGYRTWDLNRLALTADYVWNFDDGVVRKRPR